jgi:hypothetical protein
MPIHDWTRVDAGIFHDFHHEWISTTKRALNDGRLPPDYYALADQITGGLHPDVVTLEHGRPATNGNGTASSAPTGGGVALATTPPQVRFTAVTDSERYAQKRSRIAIRHVSDDQVVALIELVSPGNKASRHAIHSFIEKAAEFLAAGVHLLLVDLFPPGPRDPQGIHGVVWSEIADDNFRLPDDKPLTLVAYAAGTETKAFIEPVAVGDVLKDMPLFLEPDLYVLVPLEETYVTAFEAVPRRWRDVLTA